MVRAFDSGRRLWEIAVECVRSVTSSSTDPPQSRASAFLRCLGSIQKPGRPQAAVLQGTPNRFCPEGVGVRLVGDLPRSGSKTCTCGVPDAPSWLILLPVPGRSPTRWSATAATSHAFGRSGIEVWFGLFILAEVRGSRLAGEGGESVDLFATDLSRSPASRLYRCGVLMGARCSHKTLTIPSPDAPGPGCPPARGSSAWQRSAGRCPRCARPDARQ